MLLLSTVFRFHAMIFACRYFAAAAERDIDA